MRKIELMAVALTTVTTGWLQATALLTWEFSGINSAADTPTLTKDTLVSTGGFRRGAGAITSGLTRPEAWGGTGFSGATKADSILSDTCLMFDIIVGADVLLSLDSIEAPWFGYQVSGGPGGTGGTLYGQWQYSLSNGLGWSDIGGETGLLPFGYYDWLSLDLKSYTDLQGITDATVTFRLLLWGGDKQGNTEFYFGKDTVDPLPGLSDTYPNSLTINGTVITLFVPEPSAAFLAIIGAASLLLRRRHL